MDNLEFSIRLHFHPTIFMSLSRSFKGSTTELLFYFEKLKGPPLEGFLMQAPNMKQKMSPKQNHSGNFSKCYEIRNIRGGLSEMEM